MHNRKKECGCADMIQINSDQQSQEAASVGARVCAEDRRSIKVLDSSNGDGDFQKVWLNLP